MSVFFLVVTKGWKINRPKHETICFEVNRWKIQLVSRAVISSRWKGKAADTNLNPIKSWGGCFCPHSFIKPGVELQSICAETEDHYSTKLPETPEDIKPLQLAEACKVSNKWIIFSAQAKIWWQWLDSEDVLEYPSWWGGLCHKSA